MTHFAPVLLEHFRTPSGTQPLLSDAKSLVPQGALASSSLFVQQTSTEHLPPARPCSGAENTAVNNSRTPKELTCQEALASACCSS